MNNIFKSNYIFFIQKLLVYLWNVVIEIYEFIYFLMLNTNTPLFLDFETSNCGGNNLAPPYYFCHSSQGDDSKKPYVGKGKGRATEEDLKRIEREERGLPPESITDEDLMGIQEKEKGSPLESSTDYDKKKQEEYDYLLATYLQEEENKKKTYGDPLDEELEAKDKIEKLESEAHKLAKLYNVAWDEFLSGNITEEEKSKKEKEVSILKYEYYNKSNELNKSKSAFQDSYGYTPIPADVSTEGESSEPEYDSSGSGDDKRPSPRNTPSKDDPCEGPSTGITSSKHDPCEGPSTGTTQSKYDSDEERPHKKYKFSHDSIGDSKKFFLPILYRPFFKKFLCFIKIFLLYIPICFPKWFFFIHYLIFIDLYFIDFIVTKLESAMFFYKIWKKIKLFVKITKHCIKLACNHYNMTLIFLILFSLILIVVWC